MKLPTKVEARGRTFQVIDASGFVVCDVITGDSREAMLVQAKQISDAINAAMGPAVAWRLVQKYVEGPNYVSVHETEAEAVHDARGMGRGFVEGRIEPLVPMPWAARVLNIDRGARGETAEGGEAGLQGPGDQAGP